MNGRDYMKAALLKNCGYSKGSCNSKTSPYNFTTENKGQAIERAGTKAGNRGYDCALGVIEMVNLLHEIEGESY